MTDYTALAELAKAVEHDVPWYTYKTAQGRAEDREFIAAASPDVVLSILAELTKYKTAHEVNTDTLNAMQAEIEQRDEALRVAQQELESMGRQKLIDQDIFVSMRGERDALRQELEAAKKINECYLTKVTELHSTIDALGFSIRYEEDQHQKEVESLQAKLTEAQHVIDNQLNLRQHCLELQAKLDAVAEAACDAVAFNGGSVQMEAHVRAAVNAAAGAAPQQELEELLGRYWDIAYSEGKTGISRGTEAQEVLSAIRRAQPVAQEPRIVATKTWFENGKLVTQNLTVDEVYLKPEEREAIEVNQMLLEALKEYRAILNAGGIEFPENVCKAIAAAQEGKV